MSRIKILVLEDENTSALDLKTRLSRMGYAVTDIAIQEEAINKAAFYPERVLMDISLKENIDGVKAAQQIYNDLNIPVIHLTTNTEKKTTEPGNTLDILRNAIKPHQERELHTTIGITLSRYRTERKLKESEQWLATVLKSIGDGVIASDALGAVAFMNPVAEALTGWKQEDALGRDVTEIFHILNEETLIRIFDPVTQALQSGVSLSLAQQTILIAKNGAEIPIDHSVAPIKDDQGNVSGAVLIFRDITERKRAEEARQKQIEQERLVAQLEKLNQLKDDFLSTVSHELRTPMSNMKMAIQMLKVAGGLQERSQRYLEILQSECQREIELINGLLDLQRLETASYPFMLSESVSLQDLLPKIVEPFQVRTRERQQTLQVHFPFDVPPLISDRSILERILAELLNNACKYTPPDGEIALRVRYVDSTPLASVPVVILTVSNTVEIPATELPRIFEKFYRIPKADPWKQGGTGLGLALVKKLVEQLQGSIHVDSSSGWTTFTVQLFQSLQVSNEYSHIA